MITRPMVVVVWVVLLVVGCASRVPAPVGRPKPAVPPVVAPLPQPNASEKRLPGMHRVRSGETLYSIAWRYGLDYKQLARLNGIGSPYVIYPGQQLRTKRAAARAPVRPRGRPRRDAAVKPRPPPAVTPSKGKVAALSWQWPTNGTVIQGFKQSGKRGIDISGHRGQPVRAAASGRVVYSGGGLLGYGKLIIVKHSTRYLTAYAHNEKILVSEGDTVRGGDTIARMGSSGTDRVKLHFEIRRDGSPVDPARFLPRKS